MIQGRDSLEIVIANEGKVPMPVRLAVTRIDGRVEDLTEPVDVWLEGGDRHTVRVAREPAVKSIELDPEKEFPDLDRSNQVWPR